MPKKITIGPNGSTHFKYLLGSDNKASKLRKKGKLKEAYDIFIQAEPSQYVLDELRKIASAQARIAKEQKNWLDVVKYLEGYNAYASKWREYCRIMVNASPPTHTKTDKKMLADAKNKLIEQGIVMPAFDYETVEVVREKFDMDKFLEEVDKILYSDE